MSMTPPRRTPAAYRLPGVFALALLGGAGIYTAHRAEQTFSERSATSRLAPELLRLHSTSADVQIVPGTGRRIQIEWQADWVGGRPSHFLRTSDGVIDLGGSCRGGLTHVTGLFAFQNPCSIRYRIARAARPGDPPRRRLGRHVAERPARSDHGARELRRHRRPQPARGTGSS